MIENGTYLAKTHDGLESLLKKELQHAGASYIFQSGSSVRFQADDEELYSFLLHTRVTIQFGLILCPPIDTAEADLSTLCGMVQWTEVIPVHSVFKVRAFHGAQQTSALRHLASELEQGICRVFQKQFETTPKIADADEDAEFIVNLQIGENGSCQLTLEAGGPVFERRGMIDKDENGIVSPAMAAGLIRLTGWRGSSAFIDPFANNGSFVIEAARIAKKRPPLFEDDNILMKKWRTFRHALWKKKREEVVAVIRKDVDWILGSDTNYNNISKIQYRIRNLRLNNNIKLRVAKPNTIFFPNTAGQIVTSPPANADMKLLGDFARKTKEQATGYKMAIFSPLNNIDTIMGMKPHKTLRVGYDERTFYFMQFEIFNNDSAKPTPGKKIKSADKTRKPGGRGSKPNPGSARK